MFTASNQTAPNLGIMSNPVGGTQIEQWTKFETQLECVNATCMADGNHDPYQPLNKRNCTKNALLYNGNIEPLVNMTLNGFIWFVICTLFLFDALQVSGRKQCRERRW
jgi:hypothetical protein